ncbi:MAG TPA: methyltransferase domain-containing protein [Anaeromyxobacter sp.]|nr:methyltransferase domain-containing protein [Anaeromyxobacter sp.]
MLLDKALLARRFGRAAPRYLRHARVQEQAAGALLRAVLLRRPAEPVARLLDVGCGTGLSTALLLEAFPGAHALALDLAPGMIDEARRRLRGKPVSFTVADVEAGVPAGPFELVASSMALQWTLDPAAVLRAAAGRLTAGGLLAVAVPVEGTLRELREAYAAAADALALPAWRHPGLAFHPAALWAAWARAAFAEVEVEELELEERHADARAALESVRGVGASDCGGAPGPAALRLLRHALAAWDARFARHGSVAATWRIAILTARGPRSLP